jgi:hypothetical protein
MKYSSRTSHTLISLANGTSRTLMNPPFVNGRYIDQWELPLMNGRLPLVNGSYWRTGGTRSREHALLPSRARLLNNSTYTFLKSLKLNQIQFPLDFFSFFLLVLHHPSIILPIRSINNTLSPLLQSFSTPSPHPLITHLSVRRSNSLELTHSISWSPYNSIIPIF